MDYVLHLHIFICFVWWNACQRTNCQGVLLSFHYGVSGIEAGREPPAMDNRMISVNIIRKLCKLQKVLIQSTEGNKPNTEWLIWNINTSNFSPIYIYIYIYMGHILGLHCTSRCSRHSVDDVSLTMHDICIFPNIIILNGWHMMIFHNKDHGDIWWACESCHNFLCHGNLTSVPCAKFWHDSVIIVNINATCMLVKLVPVPLAWIKGGLDILCADQ